MSTVFRQMLIKYNCCAQTHSRGGKRAALQVAVREWSTRRCWFNMAE